jgi:hypothetical protein
MVTFELASLFALIGASVAPCEQPLNCGEFNKSTVCNHTFAGCDVCDTCCHSWLKPVDICDGCVQDECTSGRHPDCCVSFECGTNGRCTRAFRATGAYPTLAACEEACKAPSIVCTGSSANLSTADCSAWLTTIRASPYFAQNCNELSHLEDPCSCGHIGCDSDRIVSIIFGEPNPLHSPFNASKEDCLSMLTGLQQLVFSSKHGSIVGPVPAWLIALTSLTHIDFQGNRLTGTIPSQLAELTKLTALVLSHTQLTGTIPPQLAKLTRLSTFCVDDDSLTGTVPSLPFEQYTGNCCIGGGGGNKFKCPLPPGHGACLCSGRGNMQCS